MCSQTPVSILLLSLQETLTGLVLQLQMNSAAHTGLDAVVTDDSKQTESPWQETPTEGATLNSSFVKSSH